MCEVIGNKQIPGTTGADPEGGLQQVRATCNTNTLRPSLEQTANGMPRRGLWRRHGQTCISMNVSGFPGGLVIKNPPASAGDARDAGLIPWSKRSPGSGNGNPLHYSCPENPTDEGAWRATVHIYSLVRNVSPQC